MNNWFEKTILDGIKELDEENEEIYEQAKQVLILSRTQNQYKENTGEIQLFKNNTLNSERIIIRGDDYER